MKIPDVLGYLVDDAVYILRSAGFQPIIVESYGKKILEEGKPRVLRQAVLDNNEIQLIISLF